MLDSGRIDIRIEWQAPRVARVDVASTRPAVVRALVGRPVGEALELVPLLFSLCGRAQGLCARVAAAAAQGRDGAAEAAPAALAAEMAFEHLWRLWIDWPALLGLPDDRAGLARVGAALRACKPQAGEETARAAARALEAALRDWLGAAPGAAALASLAPGAATPALDGAASTPAALFARLAEHEQPGRWPARSLPAAPLAELRARWPLALDAAFAAAPTHDGAPAETGAIARHAAPPLVAAWQARERPLAARLAARVVALLECLDVLRGTPAPADWSAALALAPGAALARVETARGLLVHRLRLEDGRVADYVIVAPTEWNFHPRGPFVQALEGRDFADAAVLRRHAEALALALDPCVECSIEVLRR